MSLLLVSTLAMTVINGLNNELSNGAQLCIKIPSDSQDGSFLFLGEGESLDDSCETQWIFENERNNPNDPDIWSIKSADSGLYLSSIPGRLSSVKQDAEIWRLREHQNGFNLINRVIQFLNFNRDRLLCQQSTSMIYKHDPFPGTGNIAGCVWQFEVKPIQSVVNAARLRLIDNELNNKLSLLSGQEICIKRPARNGVNDGNFIFIGEGESADDSCVTQWIINNERVRPQDPDVWSFKSVKSGLFLSLIPGRLSSVKQDAELWTLDSEDGTHFDIINPVMGMILDGGDRYLCDGTLDYEYRSNNWSNHPSCSWELEGF